MHRILARPALPGSVILPIVCLGVFVAALDQTVVYGALAGMLIDVGLPITQLDQAVWIVLGYLVGYTFVLPLMGRVADVWGHSRVYILSLAVFALASVFVALAPDLNWLIGARVLQAIGGGALVPVAMAIVGDVYPMGGRAIPLGIIGAAVEAGGALGPVYGGAMAYFVNWRWIFWLNVPLAMVVAGLLLARNSPSPLRCAQGRLSPSPRGRGKKGAIPPLSLWERARVREGAGRGTEIDFFGGLLAGGALVAVGVGLSGAYAYLLLPLAGVFLALFVWREWRVAVPLLDLSMFRVRAVAAANVTNLLVGAALIIAMVNIPLMSDTILQCTPLEGGLRVLRLTALLCLGALVGGALCKRLGYHVPTVLGLLLSAAGLFLMSRWTTDIADPELTLHLAVCGFGFGIVIAPIATAVVDSVGEGRRAVASSIVVMLRMVGMIVGLSAITAWGVGRFHLMVAGLTMTDIANDPQEVIVPALALFQDFFLAAAVVCLVAIVPALWLVTTISPSTEPARS